MPIDFFGEVWYNRNFGPGCGQRPGANCTKFSHLFVQFAIVQFAQKNRPKGTEEPCSYYK